MADDENKKGLRKISRHEQDIDEKIRAEVEKQDREIEALRAKAEERRKRQEDDRKRIDMENARIEAERRSREEAERKRKEALLQKKKKQELDKLRTEAKKIEQMAAIGSGGSKLSNVLKAKEDMQKSPEQLEQEKREIIGERLVKLDLNGLSKDELIKEAEKFYKILYDLHSQIYELTEKHDRQKYDMMELAERARQIEKGKAKTRKSNIVHTGLGGSVFSHLNELFPQAPQKISLFSRYERVTDRRTFKDRRELWTESKEKKEVQFEKPKAKIKHIDDQKKPEPVKRRQKKETAEQPKEEQQKPQEEHNEAAEEGAQEEAPQEEEE